MYVFSLCMTISYSEFSRQESKSSFYMIVNIIGEDNIFLGWFIVYKLYTLCPLLLIRTSSNY